MLKGDFQRLELISEHCKDILEMKKRFGNTKDDFKNDKDYQYAACMCILQIGEHSNKLSDDVKKSFQDINWKSIKSMRNIFAHNYGIMNPDLTWHTITKVIPVLYKSCQKALANEYCYRKVSQEECDEITKSGIIVTAKSDSNYLVIRYHKEDDAKVSNIINMLKERNKNQSSSPMKK